MFKHKCWQVIAIAIIVGLNFAPYAQALTFREIVLDQTQGKVLGATTDGLAAYWNFDEGSGTVVRDASGNGKDGAINGNAVWASGISGGALQFDGSTTYVLTPAVSLGTSFTVAAWVKPAVATQASGARIVESRYQAGFALAADPLGKNYKFMVNSTQSPFGNAKGGTFDTQNWQMVAGVYDGTTGTLFVNGSPVASDTFTAAARNFPIYIGKYFAASSSYWNGLIDEVRIYNRALSSVELEDIRSASIPLAAPAVSSFAASQPVVNAGQSVTLSWSASGNPAPAVSIDNGVGTVTGSSVTVTPTQTTTYTLTAANSQGSAIANVTVMVSNTPLPQITSGPSSVPADSSASVMWATNVATDVQIEYGTTVSYGQSTTLDSSLSTSHTQTISGLNASTLYHYRVKSKDSSGNAAVSADQTFTTLAAPPAPTVPAIPSFTASPATVVTGGSTTLSWTVSGADSLDIDNGVGMVTGRTSVTVSPSQTTTYRLSATNAQGLMTRYVLVTVVPAVMPTPATYYISPSGSDSNNGMSASQPFKTFNKAFTAMKGGDTLYLLDGTYSIAAGTGVINYMQPAPSSARIPNGIDRQHMTTIQALNPGSVFVEGTGLTNDPGRNHKASRPLMLGSPFDGSPRAMYLKFQDITFLKGGSWCISCANIYFKNTGFEDSTSDSGWIFALGGSDLTGLKWPTNLPPVQDILIEDSWIWGKARGAGYNYYGNNVTFRRVVVRLDGCDAGSVCVSAGEPNHGLTSYNSVNSIFENNLVLDHTAGAYSGYGDFSTAGHPITNPPYNFALWGGHKWLGNISLNPVTNNLAFNIESDNPAGAPVIGDANYPGTTYYFRDNIAWNSYDRAFIVDCTSNKNNCWGGSVDLQNFTASISRNGSGDLFDLPNNGGSTAPSITGSISGLNLFTMSGGRDRSAINTATLNPPMPPNNSNLFGTWWATSGNSGYYGTSAKCASGCLNIDPLATGAIKYLPRVENGSALKGTGPSGTDVGATVMYAYGTDGSFYGDVGYDQLTSKQLWPWPNDARIVKETCTDYGATRSYCSAGSITKYMWEQLGNAMPANFYDGSGGPVLPQVPTIASFTATPASITSGQSATLSWSASNATSLPIANP